MARGPSGKLVIEVDPALKDALYLRLSAERTTVKDWFIRAAKEYIDELKPAHPLRILRVAESPSATTYEPGGSK